MFDEAHGATLSAVWGSWARYVYQLDIVRFANYGKKVWNIEVDKAEGGMFDEAHGATLSAVWGSWARYVYQLDIVRFANYGKKVWNIEVDKAEEAAIVAIEKTEEFFRALDMPVSIGELSIHWCTAG